MEWMVDVPDVTDGPSPPNQLAGSRFAGTRFSLFLSAGHDAPWVPSDFVRGYEMTAAGTLARAMRPPGCSLGGPVVVPGRHMVAAG